MQGTQKFDEYRFFVESTQHLSERRQATTQTYLAVEDMTDGCRPYPQKAYPTAA